MNTAMRRAWIAILVLASCAVDRAQAQTVTFATFQQTNLSSTPFTFTNSTTSGTFTTTSTAIKFDFSGLAGVIGTDLAGDQNATVTITTTTSTPISGRGTAGSPYNQVIDSGTITITRDTAAAEGTGSRTNLLTVTFSDSPASISGRNGSGSFSGSNPTVTFSSDFINFSGTTESDFAIALTSVTPTLAKSGNFLRSFEATGSGQFDANPGPSLSRAPEPGSMTLICAALLGGIPICTGYRRLRRTKSTAV